MVAPRFRTIHDFPAPAGFGLGPWVWGHFRSKGFGPAFVHFVRFVRFVRSGPWAGQRAVSEAWAGKIEVSADFGQICPNPWLLARKGLSCTDSGHICLERYIAVPSGADANHVLCSALSDDIAPAVCIELPELQSK